jgi:hypothetical protein
MWIHACVWNPAVHLTHFPDQPFSFFEVGYIGLPAAGVRAGGNNPFLFTFLLFTYLCHFCQVAIIYLMTFGFWVLPDTGSGMLGQAQKVVLISSPAMHQNLHRQSNWNIFQGSEEFVTELAISDDFKGIGSSIYAVRQ